MAVRTAPPAPDGARARRWSGKRLLLLLLALALIGFAVVRLAMVQAFGVDSWHRFPGPVAGQSRADRQFSGRFLRPAPDLERYRELFGYFASAARQRTRGSRIVYAGYGSTHGYAVSGVEGFARIAPLLGAYATSGHANRGQAAELVGDLRRAVLAGTDPDGAEYWGKVEPNEQQIVEAADIVRMLWLTRAQLWDRLAPGQQRQVAAWLRQVDQAGVRGRRNNWLLFPVVVNAFLKSVGFEPDPNYRNYWDFKRESYRESGWFSDGPDGPVDYYNAWGISYDLFWLHLMDPGLDRVFLREALVQSGKLTAHLVSPRGIPIMGRSLCYRTAVPAPVIAASLLSPGEVGPGEARRAMDVTWRYFVARGALEAGGLTMGYYGNDPRLVDAYSGPGSCHWGLRSLTLAFMAGPDHPFWTAPQQALPVERADYRIEQPRLGWVITGDRERLEIVVDPDGGKGGPVRLDPYTARHRLLEGLAQRPCRPKNLAGKYELASYSATRPWGGAMAIPPAAAGDEWSAIVRPPWGCGFNLGDVL